MRYCISCKKVCGRNDKFCESCRGETIEFPVCKKCGAEITDTYCPSCGRHKNDSNQIEMKNGRSEGIFLGFFHKFIRKQKESLEPFPIVIVEFPKQYREPISKMLFGIEDPSPKPFRKYLSIAKKIKNDVCDHSKLYELPDVGKERIIGWAVDGKKVFDSLKEIDTGSFGGTFSASGYAKNVKKVNGVVMAWLHRSNPNNSRQGEGMFIWPVDLVIYNTNQVFSGL